MLVSYGKSPDPEFDRFLDEMSRSAITEVSPSGFAYGVSDKIIGANVTGRVVRRPDIVEADVILGSDIPEVVRPAVAEICFESFSPVDVYSVVRACHSIGGSLSDEHRNMFVDVIRENMAYHRNGFRSLEKRGEFIHPLMREQWRSTVGWVALSRTVSEKGQEAIERMQSFGLYIPNIQDDQALEVPVRKERGGYTTARLQTVTERGERHRCRCCSGQIPKNTDRITMLLDQEPGQVYNHHHFHPVCFAEQELPKLDLEHARVSEHRFS